MSSLADLETAVQVLKRVNIFVDVKENNEALQWLSKIMDHKVFRKDDVIIREGDEGAEFFILTKGSVCISRQTPEGDSYKVIVLNSSNNPAFGEGALIGGEKRSATVSAESDCECYVLSQSKFTDFSVKFPHYAYPILKRIAQNLMGRLTQTSHDLMLLHKALMDEIRST